MALTMSTAWEESRLNLRARRAVVLVLTDGTNTWYIGTQEMILTDGHVYPGLQSWSNIQSGADIYSKRWTVPNITVQVANYPHTRTESANSFKRWSDILTGLRGETAELYFFVGDHIASLADGLKRFKGTVQADPEYDGKRLRIKIVADLLYNDRMLPEHYIGDVWGNTEPAGVYDATPEDAIRLMPLAWGKYFMESEDVAPVGGAYGVRARIRTYCLADHTWHTIANYLTTATYYGGYYKLPELPDVSMMTYSSALPDGNAFFVGYAVVAHLYGSGGYMAKTLLRPSDSDTGDYNQTLGVEDLENPGNAYNRNPENYATLNDYADSGAGGTGYMRAHAMFCWGDYAAGGQNDNSIGRNNVAGNWALNFIAECVASSAKFASAYSRLYYGVSGTDQLYTIGNFTPATAKTKFDQDISNNADPPDLAGDWVWHLRSGDVDNGGAKWPFVIRIYLETGTNDTTGTPDANGTLHDQWIMRLYDVRLEIDHDVKTGPDHCWAEGEAREYGSWISSRSSNYASGDAIEDPAGIIESVLRDVLGFTSSQIDGPSFIGAENISVKARVNLYDDFRLRASELIRMIAEQSTFMFVLGPVGTARLVSLADKTPTINHTIPFSHVKGGVVTVRKTSIIRETLIVQSRWRGEFARYEDIDTITDATASGLIYTATWRFVAGTSADAVAALYVNSTDGIWSKEHTEVEFETVGLTWAHVEEGDWVHLDSITFDPQIKAPGGTSWSGKDLLVIDVDQGEDGTKLTLVELW
jgi:hypothetical protein